MSTVSLWTYVSKHSHGALRRFGRSDIAIVCDGGDAFVGLDGFVPLRDDEKPPADFVGEVIPYSIIMTRTLGTLFVAGDADCVLGCIKEAMK